MPFQRSHFSDVQNRLFSGQHLGEKAPFHGSPKTQKPAEQPAPQGTASLHKPGHIFAQAAMGIRPYRIAEGLVHTAHRTTRRQTE